MSLHLREESLSTIQMAGEKSLIIRDHIPGVDLPSTVRHLSLVSDEDITRLKTGAFGSLAFDIVFSPGIIPKKREIEYRKAYTDFFMQEYGLNLFDGQELFVPPNESDFHRNTKTGPNENQFIHEWVANLRAIALMLTHFRPFENSGQEVKNNLIEAALCRMAENGDLWPDDLVCSLPYKMQERLGTLKDQVDREINEGKTLAPGQFFRIANELEFKEREFLRGSINSRIDMVISEIAVRPTQLPPEPSKRLSFNPGVDWHQPSPRQFRQVNLSSLLQNPEQALTWTKILLGEARIDYTQKAVHP